MAWLRAGADASLVVIVRCLCRIAGLSVRERWQRIPVFWKLKPLAVAAVAAAVWFPQPMATEAVSRSVALQLPQVAERPLWSARVERFAHRVSSAFSINYDVAQEFAPWILEGATRHELDPDLLASLVFIESTFRKNARSYVGAIGPAQVRADYWSGFCGQAIRTDPEQNVYCGAQILAHLRDQCGNNECALRAYNVGPYSSRHSAGQRYVRKIDRHVEKLAAL